MSAEAVTFYILAAVTLGSAAVVVLSKSLINSAFSLLFSFFGVAGFYVLLGADFLAASQLLIYVGGILMLLLFGVMLTHKLYDLDLRSEANQLVPGLIVAAGLFTILAWPGIARPDSWAWAWPLDRRGLLFAAPWAAGAGRAPAVTTAEIGRMFLGPYLLPFEAASVLLLVALMGAALIVRRRKDA